MKIVTFMPGSGRESHPHQQAVRECLKAEGLLEHTEEGLQINSFLNGREGFPDRVDLEDFRANERAARAYRQSRNRDWVSAPPSMAYYDYEPQYVDPETGRTVAWVWQGHTGAYDQQSIDLVHEAVRQIRAEAIGLPLALYGIPWLNEWGSNFFGLQRYMHGDMQRLLDPFDFVLAGFYVRDRERLEGTPDRNVLRYRVKTGLAAAAAMGKPIVPILRFRSWPVPGAEALFAEHLCGALGDYGPDYKVETIGIWENPKDAAHAANVIARLRMAAPYLRRLVGIPS